MKILVCADGSPNSQDAILALSRSDLLQNALVQVLHVDERGHHEDESEVVRAAMQILENGNQTAKLESSFVKGNVGQKILEVAAAWGAELIVMGTNNRHGLDKLLLGSVSDFVSQKAACPVLIARPVNASFNNVLVALDDSETSSTCLEWLSTRLWSRSKNIVMLSVAHGLPSGFANEMNTDKASKMILQQQIDESRLSHLSERWSELAAATLGRAQVPFAMAVGEPVENILDAAKNWPAEMLVVGSHGRLGLDKLLHGSVSNELVHKAACSVLVVHGQTSGAFEKVRAIVTESRELAEVMSEKAHPARVTGTMTEINLNGYFPNNF